MNRKARRAAGRRRDEGAATPNVFTLSHTSVGIAGLSAEADRCYRQGRMGEAQAICGHILARAPEHVQSLNLLGLVVQTSGDHRTAVKMFAKALAVDQLNTACHYNIGNSYQALGRRDEALAHFRKALAFGMGGGAVVNFILESPVIASCLARIADKWPLPVKGDELYGSKGLAPLAEDLFLRCAMASMTLESVALEMLLTNARAKVLRIAGGQETDAREADAEIVAFACALAQQCFINEYIYVQAAEEIELAASVRDRLLHNLVAGDAIPPLALAAVAAFFPLHTLPGAEALLRREWPAVADPLLQQQLREPFEEAGERTAITALTPVRDRTSLQVMRQYEESPYPRWTINPLAAFVVDRTQGKTIPKAEANDELDILIAGCGTGLHAVQVAQVYPKARLLAVDMSVTSLAYARRKTRELGLCNIEYAQADILELASIGRTFDRVESVGVLHHLAHPTTGWRVLLEMLRPGGQMRVGLYSETARGVIVEARARIAARGYQATAQDIRKCRQDIVREADGGRWKALIGSRDFYSMSGCRDLLFNVMEHRFTIAEIAAFLDQNDLSFLGFEFFDDRSVIEKFQQRFPDPAAMTNIEYWRAFEADNPQTFWGMYLFLLRKSAS